MNRYNDVAEHRNERAEPLRRLALVEHAEYVCDIAGNEKKQKQLGDVGDVARIELAAAAADNLREARGGEERGGEPTRARTEHFVVGTDDCGAGIQHGNENTERHERPEGDGARRAARLRVHEVLTVKHTVVEKAIDGKCDNDPFLSREQRARHVARVAGHPQQQKGERKTALFVAMIQIDLW